MNERNYPRPNRRLLLTEGARAIAEMATLLPAAPLLSQAPRGDGHPVLVMPGYFASDRSTAILRHFLRSLGYLADPWKLGTNFGPTMPDLHRRLAQRLGELFAGSSERKVSLVGWSLGGVYARVLAHLYPRKVRQVITLGSPFAGHPRSTSAYPIFKNLHDVPLEELPLEHLRQLAGDPLPGVPGTAIFSKSDGIVPWQIATQPSSAIAENIEVYGSHVGLGINPSVLFAVADRLAQSEGDWQPFERRGWKRLVYGAAQLAPDDTTIDEQAGNATVREHQ